MGGLGSVAVVGERGYRGRKTRLFRIASNPKVKKWSVTLVRVLFIEFYYAVRPFVSLVNGRGLILLYP